MMPMTQLMPHRVALTLRKFPVVDCDDGPIVFADYARFARMKRPVFDLGPEMPGDHLEVDILRPGDPELVQNHVCRRRRRRHGLSLSDASRSNSARSSASPSSSSLSPSPAFRAASV